MMEENLLEIQNLTVEVKGRKTSTVIVDHVNLTIPSKSIVALVGGSGSGKTTTGFSVLRLLSPGLAITSGQVLFQGKNLLSCPESELRRIRGGEISMVFQEPLNAFNPLYTIAFQIEEMLQQHTDMGSEQRKKRVLELLDQVGLPSPERVARSYPHQLSGGMRQRAMIALAISAGPKLLIADEPTSNLDVTRQAKIIEMFKRLRQELDLSIFLITHDLGMVENMADHVAVMCDGKIVEQGPTQDILEQPQHEYTKRLMGVFDL